MEQTILDRLSGALIGLAKTTGNKPGDEHTAEIFTEGLCLYGKTEADTSDFFEMIARVHAERHRLSPDCATCQSPCGNTSDYAMANIWESGDGVLIDVVKKILAGLVLLAEKAQLQQGETRKKTTDFLCHGLSWLGYDLETDYLQQLLSDTNAMLERQ